MIPQRFQDRVLRHALSVYTIPTYPLILAIQGSPGVGKSYQTYQTLNSAQFRVFRTSSATLQGKHEGDSVAAFMTLYEEARACALDTSQPSPAILIEDFDLSGAVRLQQTEYTVNQQLLVSSIMNLCDGIDPEGRTAIRIPMFFTGNNFSTLHGPLRRHGRLDVFTWTPEATERAHILTRILERVAADPQDAAFQLARLLPKETIASIRFLIDQVESIYMHRQLKGTSYQSTLGQASWDKLHFTPYSNISTRRLLQDIQESYTALESTTNFLDSYPE